MVKIGKALHNLPKQSVRRWSKFFRHVYKAFPKNKLPNSIGKAKAIPNESLQQMDSYFIGMA